MDDQKNKIANILSKKLSLKIFKHSINYNIGISDVFIVEEFCDKLESVLKTKQYSVNQHCGPIALICDTEQTFANGKPMCADTFVEYLTSNLDESNVILSDIKGNLNGFFTDKIISNHQEAAIFCSESNKLLFFICGTQLDVYWGNEPIHYTSNFFTDDPVGIVNNDRHPISYYEILIEKHFKEYVYKQKKLIYWQSTVNRYLMPAPENIFKKSLAGYFDSNVTDGAVLPEALNALTNDRNDIRVIEYLSRNIYIFEIKWLGTSIAITGKFTKYDDSAADAGIVQLNLYLGQEPKAKYGVLVIYDGRIENKDINWNSGIIRNKYIKDPIRKYLVSESASQKAKRIVADIKRNKKRKKKK